MELLPQGLGHGVDREPTGDEAFDGVQIPDQLVYLGQPGHLSLLLFECIQVQLSGWLSSTYPFP